MLTILVSGFFALMFLGWAAFKFTLRDPDRKAPDEKNIIVAPADGKVKYIRKIEKGTIVYSEKKRRKIPILESTKIIQFHDGYLIGIWMSYLNVHIQRVPVSGIVETQHYYGCGKFLDPKFQADYEYINERNILAIRSESLPAPIIVIQIASITVRRIISFLKEKMQVKIGDRLGMIRFGSQVDIIIPDTESVELNISVGDCVVAGESIIARYGAK